MELVKLNVKVRCDMGLCKNLAAYSIAPSRPKASLPWRREAGGTYICEECLTALYAAIGKVLVPKSPDNMIKKAIKRREKNENEKIG